MSTFIPESSSGPRTLWALRMMGLITGVFILLSPFMMPVEIHGPWWSRITVCFIVLLASALNYLSPWVRRFAFFISYSVLFVLVVWTFHLLFRSDFAVQYIAQFLILTISSTLIFQSYRLLLLFLGLIMTTSLGFFPLLEKPAIDPTFFYLMEFSYLLVLSIGSEQNFKLRNKLHQQGLLQTIINQASFKYSEDGILVVNAKDEIIQYNQAFLEMWGFEKADLKMEESRAGLSKAKAQMADPEGFERFSILAKRNVEHSKSQTVFLKDGRVFERHFQALFHNEKRIGRIWFFKDLTEVTQKKIKVESQNQLLEAERKALLSLAVSPNVQRGFLNEALLEIIKKGQSFLQVDKVIVWVSGENDNLLECRLIEGWSGTTTNQVPDLEKKLIPNYLQLLDEVRVFQVSDTNDVNFSAPLNLPNLSLFSNARLDIPLRLKGVLIGIISFQAKGPVRQWLREDVNFLASLGDVTLLALQSSKRKETETQLEESLAVLKAVFEMGSQGIIISYNNGAGVDCNENYISMWNIPPELLKPGREMEIVAYVQSQMIEKNSSEEAVEYLINYPGKNRHDILHLKDGRIIERNTEILSVGAEIIGRIWYYKDISERVKAAENLIESEAHHRAIVNAVPDLLFRIDGGGKLLDVKIPDIPEFSPLHLKTLLNITDVFKEDFCGDLLVEIKHVLNTKSKVELNKQLEFLDSLKDLEVRIVPSGDNEVLLVIRNVSQRKTTERELIQRNFELDSFVYRASHDLKAPLNSLMGLIDIIQNDNPPPELLTYIQLMDRSVTKLDTFIRNLTDFSKVSRLKIQNQEVNVKELIAEVNESLQYMDNADQIDISVSITGNESFHGDRFHLEIILSNLISNAIKYQDYKKSQRFIKVIVNAQPEGVTVQIRDNGIGISQDHQKKLFQLFFRASNQSFGSGLGLYITKNAIENINGKITLFSEEGTGTTFELSFPNKIHTLNSIQG